MRVLEDFNTSYGRIVITECDSGFISYKQNGYHMSLANSKGISPNGYINAIAREIATEARVLILGCAGGTLANMLPHANRIDIVDINPLAFKLAYKYFNLNLDANCYTQCARDYMRSIPSAYYNAVVIDCFNGEGHIPERLMTKKFFDSVIDSLLPYGKVIINLANTSLNDKERIEKYMRVPKLKNIPQCSVFEFVRQAA